jgi:hypothetical protein
MARNLFDDQAEDWEAHDTHFFYYKCTLRSSSSRLGQQSSDGKIPDPVPGAGTGVICEIRALPGAVIPAKAGIYSASHWKGAAAGLDSRFRGNDQCFEMDPIPNDTTTPARKRCPFGVMIRPCSPSLMPVQPEHDLGRALVAS